MELCYVTCCMQTLLQDDVSRSFMMDRVSCDQVVNGPTATSAVELMSNGGTWHHAMIISLVHLTHSQTVKTTKCIIGLL